jgi:hypothetical protein
MTQFSGSSSAPDANVGDIGFGIVSGTTTSPRILQLTLKVGF